MMNTGLLSTCALACLALALYAGPGAAQEVSFQTEALAKKAKCESLTRNDCLFYHEAIEKCGSVCDDRIKNGDKKPDDKGDKDKDGKGKKSDDSSGSKAACFHGDDLVQTEAGPARLADLVGRRDLRLLAADGRPSDVYYWLHADPAAEQDFLVLDTESGHRLSVTADHLIYVTDCEGAAGPPPAVFAARATLGRCLYVQSEQGGAPVESRIVRRRVERKRGVYAPVTRQGSVVVNGVLASCFACLENEALQKIMYRYMDWAARALDALAPRRLVEALYGSQWSTTGVGAPEVVFSFWDLGKQFVR